MSARSLFERMVFASTIAAASLISASPAAAQPAAPVADAADQAFERGRTLYKQDRLPEAEAAFAEAWRLKKTQDIAANLGSVELENHKYRAAAEHLAYAVRHGAPTDSDKARRASQERLDAALKHVGAVRLHVEPAGAAIYLNGELAGRAPLEGDVYVDPGVSTIEAKLEGFADAHTQVQATAATSQDVALTLTQVGRSKVPAIVLGAVGIVGVGLGATFIGLEESKRSEAQKLVTQTGHTCPVAGGGGSGCDALRSATSSGDAFGNAGIGAFIVGGAFLAGAAAYWLWPTRTAAPTTGRAWTVAPIAGPTAAGATVSGSF